MRASGRGGVLGLIAGACAGLLPMSAFAERIELEALPIPRPEHVLLADMRAGATLEGVLDRQLDILRSADRDDNGLDANDIALGRSIASASNRAQAVSRVLAFDLDGDFVVSADEALQVARTGNEERTHQAMFASYDLDGDERITLDELSQYQPEEHQDRMISAERLLALEPGGDGSLSRSELWGLVERAFARVDADGDREISAGEYAAIERTIEIVRPRLNRSRCELPDVPRDAEVVVFGTYDGTALSSVYIGRPDVETHVMDLIVEPGSQPLYIVATAQDSMIWRVRGATDRVVRLAATTSAGDPRGISATGVIGLPASKVSILRSDCVNYFTDARGAASAVYAVRDGIGREVDLVLAAVDSPTITIPGGVTNRNFTNDAPPLAGFDPDMWREATRFWPDGLIAVEPESIVARSIVRQYEVLPSQMGIAQLLGSGALVREPARNTFRVVRPIPRFPPRMGGGHAANFVLDAGIAMPAGEPGHGCIRNADGEPLAGSCRAPPPAPTISTRR